MADKLRKRLHTQKQLNNLNILIAEKFHLANLSFTTDIAAAWNIAEKIHLFDDRYIIETTNGWGIYEVAPTYSIAKELVLDAISAPLAICLAIAQVASIDINKRGVI